MVQNGPPQSPSPASANVSCQGANKLEKNKCLMIFYDCNKKEQNSDRKVVVCSRIVVGSWSDSGWEQGDMKGT